MEDPLGIFVGTRTIVYSDASDLGVGGVIEGRDGVICNLPWSGDEMAHSSTWRELKAPFFLYSIFNNCNFSFLKSL